MDELRKIIKEVNRTLPLYKSGGWIDCRRLPTSKQEMIFSLEQFVEARFNREAWSIPSFTELEELLGGHLFTCKLEGVEEDKKKFKQAVLTIIDEKHVLDPSENLINKLREAKTLIGGSNIKFTSVKVKFKIIIDDK